MDPFDTQLRARITRVVAVAPGAPAPLPGRMLAITRARRARRRVVLAAGLLMLSALAVGGLSSLGRGDFQSRLDDAGVPPGAEVIAVQADADGTIISVIYRDRDGVVHTIGDVELGETPAP
jgi:hypothetical protein